MTAAFGILLAALFMLSPSGRDAKEVATLELAPRDIVTPTSPIKLKKISAAAQTQAASAQTSAASGPSAQAQSLKNFSQSRISKLLGKLSLGPAKSSNVVVSHGIEAGSAPTAGASASLGKDLKSGNDWAKEGAKGGALGASTVGTKGNVGSMGIIGTGKAGSGGVNVADDESEVVGGLDREVIAQYVRSQLGQILYCYERALSATPDLFGKVSVNFIIGGTGLIETRTIKENTLRSAAVENCMLQRIAKWKFPAPQGGTRVVVTYPFLFKSTN